MVMLKGVMLGERLSWKIDTKICSIRFEVIQRIGKGIEFIKKIDDNILVATELDIKDGYLYIASMYSIKQAKIDRGLNSGRLKKNK